MNDIEIMNNIIATGHAVRELLENKAFLLVMESLESDKKDALKYLAVTNPENPEKIRELQNIIFRHDEMTARLSTLLQDGDIAQQELSDDINQNPV
jgi:DNA-directed RNA polymerase subunit F